MSHCKYPPAGQRSIAGTMAQLNFRAMPQSEATETVNRETMIVIMLESPAGIAQADAIAAVPGVDVLLIGTNDLCLEMGIPAQYEHPKVREAYATVIDACGKHGKHPGMGGIYDEELTTKYIQQGMRFIIAGSDTSMMMQAATHRTKFLSAISLT